MSPVRLVILLVAAVAAIGAVGGEIQRRAAGELQHRGLGGRVGPAAGLGHAGAEGGALGWTSVDDTEVAGTNTPDGEPGLVAAPHPPPAAGLARGHTADCPERAHWTSAASPTATSSPRT